MIRPHVEKGRAGSTEPGWDREEGRTEEGREVVGESFRGKLVRSRVKSAGYVERMEGERT